MHVAAFLQRPLEESPMRLRLHQAECNESKRPTAGITSCRPQAHVVDH
jgi:hypothetical protein